MISQLRREWYKRSIEEGATSDALQGYAQLLRQQGRYKEFVQVLETQLSLVSDRIKKVELTLTLAEVYEERLNRESDAQRHFEQVVRWAPRNQEALWALGAAV